MAMLDKKEEIEAAKSFYFTAFNAKHLNEELEGLTLHQETFNKDKMKTLTVALVVCLHLEVDPPDVPKVSPCCRVEAWHDPTGRNPYRSIEQIGENLQQQYERWQAKARYKKCLDPTLEEVKKLCLNLRRNAKDDRVLFHYNGHGVPRPTANGEIWVFNKTYTKYIPLNVLDLQQWMGAPSLYVFDCHRAGLLINKFHETHQKACAQNSSTQNGGTSSGMDPIRDHTIILAACGADEDLSQNPEIPADLFTACLTTPIRMAVQWYWLNNRHRYPAFLEEIIFDSIPGNFSNRQSMLGELNWIFTAVTDTIAWSSFSMDLFQKLFRQDMLVASLFRNFLLAERIGKAYGVHPVAHPALPSTAGHSMWASWDEALDQLMDQLISLYPLLTAKKSSLGSVPSASSAGPSAVTPTATGAAPLPSGFPLLQPTSTIPPRVLPNNLGFRGQAGLGFDVMDMDLVMAGDAFLGGVAELPILHHAPDEALASEKRLDLTKDLFDADDSEGESNVSLQERADGSQGGTGSSSGSHASSPENVEHHEARMRAEPQPTQQTLARQQPLRMNGGRGMPPRKGSLADVSGMHTVGPQGVQQASLPKSQSTQQMMMMQHYQGHTPHPPGGRLVRTTSGTGHQLTSGTPGGHTLTPYSNLHAYHMGPLHTFVNGSGGYGSITLNSGEQIRYRSATFFADQLRAFEIWLTTANEQMLPAMQLPILLQVLLSQIHRIHALELLCYYVDLGAWAVKHCLAVGIFPYVVRLLQSNVNEVKPLLVFLWCKIIACAETDFTKHDAVRESGYRYFSSCFSRVNQLKPQTSIMATFVLAKMLDGSAVCQEIFLKDNFLSVIKAQLQDNPPTMNNDNYIQLRHWLILCLAKLWYKNDAARWAGVRNNMQEELFAYLQDVSPLVRASTIFSLHTFVDNSSAGVVSDHAMQLNHEVGLRACRACVLDGSHLVRRELLALLAVFVGQYESQLVSIASRSMLEVMYGGGGIATARAPLLTSNNNSQQNLLRQPSVAIQPGKAKLSTPLSTARTPQSSPNISRVSSRNDIVFHASSESKSSQSGASTASTGVSVVIGNMIHSNQSGIGNVYSQLWRSLIILSHDPYTDLANKARVLVRHIFSRTKEVGGVTNCGPPGQNNIPRVVVEPRSSGTTSEVGSPDSAYEIGSARQPSPNQLGPATGLHSAVFTAPSRSRQQVLPANWSAFNLLPKTESTATMVTSNSTTDLGTPDSSGPTPVNSLHQLATLSTSNPSIGSNLRDISETQIFAWCCKQFAESGHRYQLFYAQTVAGGMVAPANYHRNAFTAVQQCKLASGVGVGSQMMPMMMVPEISHMSSLSHNYHNMGNDESSSLIRATREHLIQQHYERNVTGRRVWGEISRVSATSALATSAHNHNNSANSLSGQKTSSPAALNNNTPSPKQHPHKSSSISVPLVASNTSHEMSNSDVAVVTSPVHLHQHLLLRGRQHPLLLRFHPYMPHLAVGEPGGVSIWDLQTGERRRSLNLVPAQLTLVENAQAGAGSASGLFSADWLYPEWHTNSLATSGTGERTNAGYDVPLTTTLEFVNAHEERSLLLTGTSDGVVCVWRNYFPDLNQDQELVTAWYALTDLLHSNRPSGLVSHWHQATGQLTVSGDVKTVRIWDTQQEARVLDMPTGAESCVSALDRSKDGRLIIAGMGDGMVRLFDTRAPPGEMMVSGGQADSGWIHTVAFSNAESGFYSVDHYGHITTWNVINRPQRVVPSATSISNNISTDHPPSQSQPTAAGTPATYHSITAHHHGTAPGSHLSHIEDRGVLLNSLPKDHPRRRALEPGADCFKSISRLGKGVLPAALSQTPLQPIYSASLKVDSTEPREHLALLGHGVDTREVVLSKLTSGATQAVYRYREGFSRENIAVPLSLAFDSNQPYVGVGTSDGLVTVLQVKWK